MYKSSIYLTFTIAMVTKMARKNSPKIEELPFWTKFKALIDRFFNNLISAS